MVPLNACIPLSTFGASDLTHPEPSETVWRLSPLGKLCKLFGTFLVRWFLFMKRDVLVRVHFHC